MSVEATVEAKGTSAVIKFSANPATAQLKFYCKLDQNEYEICKFYTIIQYTVHTHTMVC